MSRVAVLLVVVPGVALLAGCGGTKTVTATVATTVTVHETTTISTTAQAAPCAGATLTGTFAVVPGSAGAGQIGYDLKLTNTGNDACWVSGLPAGDLLGANGNVLPTNIGPAHPGEAAARIVLEHDEAAVSHARFSPDVPGTGDTQGGQCEPKAQTLRILIGGGSLEVPVTPPTPVCERGSLTLTSFARS